MERKLEGIEKSGQASNRYWVWDKRRLSQWVLGWVSNLTRLVQGSSEKVLLFWFFLPWLFVFVGVFSPQRKGSEKLLRQPRGTQPQEGGITTVAHIEAARWTLSPTPVLPRSAAQSLHKTTELPDPVPWHPFFFSPSNFKNYPQAYKPLTDVSITLSLWICCLPLKQLFNCARKCMLLSWHLIYADESVEWHVVEWFQFFTKTCVNSTYWL